MPRFPTTPMCDGTLLERFEPTTRDTDVFVTTTAKCGQTWLLALLWHIRTRGRSPDFGGRPMLACMPWLENPLDMTTAPPRPYDREARLAELAAMDDPRVFKLHVVWDEVPRPPGSRARVVTVTRDPRDVPWSMFSHLSAMVPGVRPPGFVEDFDAWFEGWLERGLYFTMVRSYWAHRDDPAFLWLRYEDMKADLAREARRLVDFLGWDRSEEDLARALPLASVGHMQRVEDATRDPAGPWLPGRRFVREGAVGRNRARLSADQEARILARARAEFEPALYEWVVTQR